MMMKSHIFYFIGHGAFRKSPNGRSGTAATIGQAEAWERRRPSCRFTWPEATSARTIRPV